MKRILIAITLVFVISLAIYLVMFFSSTEHTTPSATTTSTSSKCDISNNTFFVIYLSLPPTESLFLAISKNISRSIAYDTNGDVNVTFSLCIISFRDLSEEVRNVLANRTIFPVFGFYIEDNLGGIETIKRLFNVYGNYFIIREDLVPHIYIDYMRDLYIRYRGVRIPIYNVPKVFVLAEIVKPPQIYINETPVIGSLNSKYYMVIYEDVYCIACAHFFNETLPKLEKLAKNNTFAVILKNFIVHEDALSIHRNITALYLATRNATAVLEMLKILYSKVINGVKPTPEEVAKMIKSLTGHISFNTSIEVVNKVINKDISEAKKYGIFGTPGFIIWNREIGRGIVMIGNNQLEDILKIVEKYLN